MFIVINVKIFAVCLCLNTDKTVKVHFVDILLLLLLSNVRHTHYMNNWSALASCFNLLRFFSQSVITQYYAATCRQFCSTNRPSLFTKTWTEAENLSMLTGTDTVWHHCDISMYDMIP